MAKWGEGDPRWIVEERPDATNVNNWHWAEKNATPWSKDRLKALLAGLKIDGSGIECIVDEVASCTGEATANNRKGKLIFFYEWNIVLDWSGRLPGVKDKYKGKATIPNLSEEYSVDEIEITITIDDSNSDEANTLKQFMYNVGRDVIRKQLGTYIKELKEEYSKGLILPRKSCDDVTTQKSEAPTKKNVISNTESLKVTSKSDGSASNSIGCKLDVKTLTMEEQFTCSAFDLYNVLTKQELVTAFTRDQVKIEPVRGGEFVFFGGNIHGRFVELIPERRISQTWRLKSWPPAHFSVVEIEIEQKEDHTILRLQQSGIPSQEFEATKTNWKRYYWDSIKQTFGCGKLLKLCY